MDVAKLWVGVDWGTTSHQVCVLNFSGEVQENRSFPASSAGMTAMVQCLLERSKGEPGTVYVAIERPHGAIVELLIRHDFIVHSINPKQLDRFRDRHSVAGAKDDRRDAYVLAHSLMTDSWAFTTVQISQSEIIQLRELLRIDEDLRVDENGLQSRLREQLLRYFPEMLTLIADRADPFLWSLLELAATPEQAAGVKPEQVEAILKKFRLRRLTVATVMSAFQSPRLNVSDGTIQAAVAHIRLLIPRLQLVHQQRIEVGKKLEQLLTILTDGDEDQSQEEQGRHRDAAILQSLPGVGRIVLATMLAEAGTVIARRDLQGLRSLGGIAPITRRSGKQDQRLMRRACDSRLRYAFYHWGRTAVQRDALAKHHYSELRAKGHTHGRALRGVVDRLLKVAVAMLKANTPYDMQKRQRAKAIVGTAA